MGTGNGRCGVSAACVALLSMAPAAAPGAPAAGDAAVTITTKLGVETTFVAKYAYASAPRPVERLLHQYGPDDDPGVLLQLTPSTFLIVPLGAVKSAAVEGDKTQLVTSFGAFVGRLASGLTAEGDRRYDLSTAVTLHVSHPRSKRADGRLPSLRPKGPAWRLAVPAMPDRVFDVVAAEFRFGFYTTSGYIVGGSDTFYDSGQQTFDLRVGAEQIPTQMSDFAEIGFSHAGGRLMATVKAPKGQTTSGEFVVTQTDERGEHVGHTRFLVGRLREANACFVLVSEKEPAFKLTRIED